MMEDIMPIDHHYLGEEEDKMKRVLMLSLLMLLGFGLVGCAEKDDVCIEFRINGTSSYVKIEKGTVISEAIVPIDIASYNLVMFYDEDKTIPYLDDPVNKDTVIYMQLVKDEKMTVEEMINKAKEDFENKYHGELYTGKCYGEYNGTLAFFLNGEAFDVSNPKTIDFVESSIRIMDYTFRYSHSFSILVWRNGCFYDMGDERENKYVICNRLLSEEDIKKMHEMHESF